MSSEINSTHPLYPILIPNTPYVYFFFLILFVGWSQGVPKPKIISTMVCKKFFLIKPKNLNSFILGVPKLHCAGVKQNF